MIPAASSIPDKTLETLARTFCREAKSYGFGSVDYLRYINYLMENSGDSATDVTAFLEAQAEEQETPPTHPAEINALPTRSERVMVRAFDPTTDYDFYANWLEDRYGRYFLLSRTSGKRSNLDALLESPEHRFGVIELPNGEPIGALAYLDHDKQRDKAELRKMIGNPEYRGTGLAREATELWINYGLNGLGLRKIYVNTLNTNFRNIKLNESLGFKVEGLLHNEALIDGEHQDVLRMGLCVK